MTKINYKIMEGAELDQKLKTAGITATEYLDGNRGHKAFHSDDVAIGFDEEADSDIIKDTKSAIKDGDSIDDDELGDYGFIEIPGLYCPTCGSPSVKTDHPNVASCIRPLGWFFFYLQDTDEAETGRKRKIKYVNGELTYVDEDDTDSQRHLI